MRKNYLVVLAALFSWQVFAQGETCANPITIASLPYTTTDDTGNYGNDYDNGDSDCDSYYLSGDDVVYAFTPATNMNVDVSLTNLDDTWSAVHILDGCLDGPHTCVGFSGDSGMSDRFVNVDLTGGTTYYIVISTWASPQSVGYTLSLDAITCPVPTGAGTIPTGVDALTLNWNNNSGSGEWQYEYGATGFTQGTGTSAIVTDTFANLSSVPDGFYEFYVRAICGAGDTSEWAGPVSFNVGYCYPSSTSTATYIDNFSTTGGIANISNLASGYTTGGYQDNSATMNVSVPATESFGWDLELVGGTVGTSIWIDWNENHLFEASERVYTSNAFGSGPLSGSITVPLSATPGDYKMRVLIHYNDDAPEDACASNTRLECEEYTLSVLPAPSCLVPANLGAINNSLTSGTILWEDQNGASEWQYEYGAAGFTQGSGTTGMAVDTFAVLTLPEGNNAFYVRAICGPGDTSNWAGPFNFAVGYCLPSSTDGDTYINNFTTNGGIGNISNVSSGYTTGGYANNSATMHVGVIAGESFDWNLNLVGGTIGAAIWVDWNNDLAFDASERVYNTTSYTSGPLSGTISAPVSTPDGDYRMRVLIHYNNSDPDDACASNGRLEAEDYTLSVVPELPCALPENLNATDVTLTTATLVWEDSNGAGEWQYEYGPQGFALGTGTNGTAADTFAMATAITEGYNSFYVRTICGAGDTSYWAGPFTFNAGYCMPSSTSALTYIDNFSTSNGVTDISNLSSGYTTGGYQNNGATMSASVEASESIDWDLELVGGTVGAAIWIDWNQDLTFDATERVFNTTSYTDGPLSGTINIPLTTTPDDYRMRVLIHFNDSDPDDACATNTRLEAEDYTLTVLPAPSCLSPNGLDAQNIGVDTAQLVWNEQGTAVEWQVVYGEQGTGIAGGISTITSDNPFTADNLLGNTGYEFYVRAICGPGDTSSWSGPYNFVTEMDYCGSDNFVDNGGASGNYSSNSSETTVICPQTPGDVVQVEFITFMLEGDGPDDCYDWLYIYDGADNTGTPITPSSLGLGIGTSGFCYESATDGSGNLLGEIIVATNPSGCLTFEFESDGSAQLEGWEAIVTCLTPTVDVTPAVYDQDTVFCNVSTVSPSFWVVNNGNVPATNAAYSLTVGGLPVGSGTVDVPAGDSVEVTVGPFPSATGVHEVEITTTVSGDSDPGNDVISFTVYMSNTEASVVTTTDISCFGEMDGEATASGSNGLGTYTFEWDAAAGGATTATVTGLGEGSYWVYVTDSIMCTDSAELILTQPDELIATAIDNFDQTGTASATGGTAPYTYLWDNNDQTATSAGMGDRYCVVTDANGCSDTAYIEITVSVDELMLDQLQVYPNPTTGLVIINMNGIDFNQGTIQVTDNTGKVVRSVEAIKGTQTELDLSNLENGIYFIHMNIDQHAFTKRIVVQTN